MQLIVDNLAKAFGIQEIFKDISFMVDKGEHIGLVGVNGSGKTTLLQCLLKPGLADAGSVRFEGGTGIGYVRQDFGEMRGTVWEFMLQSCPEVQELRGKMKELELRSAELQGNELKDCLEEYARITGRYEHLDGYNYENSIKKVLTGLGYPEPWWKHDADALSGGQKTRLMLAAALVKSPDFMILDEPTNHLDIAMTQWLEKYLQEFRGCMIVVSHDRALLDSVADRILEMEGGRLQSFKGNYSRYLEQKSVQTATLEAAYNSQQEYIARTEAYIRRFKAGIKSRMARGRQSQLDRLARLEEPVHKEEFALKLPPAAECADRVLVMEDLSIGYGDNVLAEGINLVLRRGDKATLLGPNGAGKTTLLKTLLGEVQPLKGSAKIGNRVRIGYFSQSCERLDPQQTLLDNFLTDYGLTEERIRSFLGGMLFHGDDAFKKIGSLSGGQKARLVLLKLVLDGANCLILDEPTNHLDIMSRETVEAALQAFDGTVLVVSHDRYFINEIATRIWVLEQGELRDYKGNYNYYMEESRRAATSAEADGETVSKGDNGEIKRQRVVVSQEKKVKRYSREDAEKLLPKVELQIREQEVMRRLVEDRMSEPDNHDNAEQSALMAAEYEEYSLKIAELMDKWEQLMEAVGEE